MSSSTNELVSGASKLQPIKVFKANNEKRKVPAVAFLPGDKHIIACRDDPDCLQVTEANTSKPVGNPWRGTADSSPICTFAVSPNGKVATGSKDGKIRVWVWNGKSAKMVDKSAGHAAAVNCVRWSSHDSGAYIANGFDDGRVAVWSVPGLKNPISTHETRLRHIYAVDYSHDGTQLIISGYDRNFSVLRINERTREIGLDKVCGVCSNPNQVLSVAWVRTTNEHDIVTGSTDCKIRVRASESPTQQWELRGHTKLVCAVVPSPDGHVLASASYDCTIHLWNLRAKRQIGQPLKHPAGVSCVAFSTDGTLLATGTCDGMIYVWDISNLLAGMTDVYDKDADNKDISVVPLLDVDSTIPTTRADDTVTSTSRYGDNFWTDKSAPPRSPREDHVNEITRATSSRPFISRYVRVTAGRMEKSLKFTRARGSRTQESVVVDDSFPRTQETGMVRLTLRAQRQQGTLPDLLDPPINRRSRAAVLDTDSRRINELRLRPTRWNKILYRVGCIAVEDD